jgi:sucrose-6-phosphate hydrolase SacC (GH32 family)
LRITSDSVTLRLLIDASSIEVLAQDGETSMTSLIFPTGPARRLRLLSPGGGTRVSSITIRPLHSALP